MRVRYKFIVEFAKIKLIYMFLCLVVNEEEREEKEERSEEMEERGRSSGVRSRGRVRRGESTNPLALNAHNLYVHVYIYISC